MTEELTLIFFYALITNNVILMKFLGLCAFFGVSNDIRPAFSMGLSVTFVITIASAVSWMINNFLLVPYDLIFLKTITFILVIATLVQIVEMFIAKFSPLLQRLLGIYLPLLTTNCAVRVVCLLSVNRELSFLQTIIHGLGAGLGFMCVICIMAGIRSRLDLYKVPKAMQGLPISFITGALLALSFLGFQGFLSH